MCVGVCWGVGVSVPMLFLQLVAAPVSVVGVSLSVRAGWRQTCGN